MLSVCKNVYTRYIFIFLSQKNRLLQLTSDKNPYKLETKEQQINK